MHKNQLCNTSQLLRRNLIPSVPQRGSSVVLFHQFALVYCKSGERGGIGIVGMRTCTCAQDVIQFFTRVQITFFGKYDYKYWPIISTCTRSRDTVNRYIMNQTEIFLITVKSSSLVGREQLQVHWRKTSSDKGMGELCMFYSSAPAFVDFAHWFFNIHLKLEN